MILEPVPVLHEQRDGLHEPVAERFRLDPEEPDHEPPEHRPPVVAGPADDDHYPDEEGEAHGYVTGRGKLAVQCGQHGARDSTDRASQDEDLEVPGLDILAHGAGGVPIVAYGTHHAPPG